LAEFDFPEIEDMGRQLTRSPAKVRRRYADRLEELLLELEPERAYPYEYVFFRVTGFRPDNTRVETYAGESIMPDLLCVLDALSDALPPRVDDVEERIYNLSEIEEMCEVSVRTLHRWRQRELVSRQYVFPDGRTRVGVRETALERYIARNKESVAWSRRFSKLTEEEEEDIVRTVRRLLREELLSVTAAAARVASEMERSPETVRLVLKRYGSEHADDPLLGQASTQLTADARRRIYAEHRQGTPVEALQERHGRSRSTIYRVINRERASEALRREISFFREPAFEEEDAEESLLGPALDEALDAALAVVRQAGSAEGLAFHHDESPPISKEHEAALFRAYNYVKFLIAETQRQIDPSRYVPARLIRRIESLQERARQVRECLLYAHLPLVMQIASLHASQAVSAPTLSDAGKQCLQEQVESFDYRSQLRFPRRLRMELLRLFARMRSQPEVEPQDAE